MYVPVLQEELLDDDVHGTSLEVSFPDSGYSTVETSLVLRGLSVKLSLKLVSASTTVLPVPNIIFMFYVCVVVVYYCCIITTYM